jgi:membrane protease YdiL (CAAX protease family)
MTTLGQLTEASVGAYLHRSRSAWYSFLFVLPLLAFYHAAILITNLGQGGVVVNGADALLQAALHALGAGGWFTSGWFVAAVAGFWIYRKDATAREALQPRTFALMLGESALYAALFGGVVAGIVRALMPWVHTGLQLGPSLGVGRSLALSLGAGLYEELVFRVLGMGGLYWLLRRFTAISEMAAAVAAVVVSSLIFSLFHYLGPMGDTFQLASFVFRFVAGVVLAALFRWRGFGIAATTHALYDVLVVFSQV